VQKKFVVWLALKIGGFCAKIVDRNGFVAKPAPTKETPNEKLIFLINAV